MTEPTRLLRDPVAQPDGSLVARSIATPERFNIRGRVYIGSRKVIPVIFVPGIMGTNLRVRRDASLPKNFPLERGAAAWRPPNSVVGALRQADAWESRSPAERQLILNAGMLEVDDSGAIDPDLSTLELSEMRVRGWGEVFASSYASLLAALQHDLNMTFETDLYGLRSVRLAWASVQAAARSDTLESWGVRKVEPVSDAELEKFASYQYPVYACGYNWLQSCSVSAKRLEKRVLEIIEWWQIRQHECRQVILVSHSMGGLVARACAKRIPDKIAGVVHGVMPALGAPLAYRRIACGTETTNPTNNSIDDYTAAKFAAIAGKTTSDTTPVMAASPGALELLPNHLYPGPWLHVRVIRSAGPTGPRQTAYDYIHLPGADKSVYDFYRDTRSWYRLFNPLLADPAQLYVRQPGGANKILGDAISASEAFHRDLGDYYHPSTFAYFGADKSHPAYGRIRWVARETSAATGVPLSTANIAGAKFVEQSNDGARTVDVEQRCRLTFAPEPQDAAGDDTVPHQSGAGPAAKARQAFPTRGYRHQGSYQDGSMVLLTRYCILKIVQTVGQS
jgi:pimeloyl-ACP methyl ester carboxylesterase